MSRDNLTTKQLGDLFTSIAAIADMMSRPVENRNVSINWDNVRIDIEQLRRICVTAVNARKALVEALQGLFDYCAILPRDWDDDDSVNEAYRAKVFARAILLAISEQRFL